LGVPGPVGSSCEIRLASEHLGFLVGGFSMPVLSVYLVEYAGEAPVVACFVFGGVVFPASGAGGHGVGV
jgi:hypothetical protein